MMQVYFVVRETIGACILYHVSLYSINFHKFHLSASVGEE